MDILTLSLAVKKALSAMGVDIEPAKLILDEPLGADEYGDFGGATNYIDRNTSGNKIIEGKSYTVTTDSGSYTSVCKKISLGDESLLFVGNGKLFGLEDTGESFFISSQFDVNSYLLICADFNSGNHIKAELAETIHPIDPKFLPGVCLPVVEIGDGYTEHGVGYQLNEVASAIVAQAIENNTPIIVTLAEQGIAVHCDKIGNDMFCSNNAMVSVQIGLADGKYMAIVIRE